MNQWMLNAARDDDADVDADCGGDGGGDGVGVVVMG